MRGYRADFNNDGLTDVLYTGVIDAINFGCTYEVCSLQPQHDAKKPQPALYLSDADGKLHYSPELLDKRATTSRQTG